MKVTMTGRRVTLKPSFEDRVEKRLKKLDRFFDTEAEAQVTVTVEKDRQTVEVTVQDDGFQVRAEKSAPQMETAFDEAAELLTRRLLKNRRRLQTKLQRPAFAELLPEDDTEVEEGAFAVVREKRVALKPESVEEAILQMNLLGHDFYVFQNADSLKTEVVYRRKGDTYGVLIPE
jgi:putative sigma-54 modulation protein